jgi:hypothetical protein
MQDLLQAILPVLTEDRSERGSSGKMRMKLGNGIKKKCCPASGCFLIIDHCMYHDVLNHHSDEDGDHVWEKDPDMPVAQVLPLSAFY